MLKHVTNAGPADSSAASGIAPPSSKVKAGYEASQAAAPSSATSGVFTPIEQVRDDYKEGKGTLAHYIYAADTPKKPSVRLPLPPNIRRQAFPREKSEEQLKTLLYAADKFYCRGAECVLNLDAETQEMLRRKVHQVLPDSIGYFYYLQQGDGSENLVALFTWRDMKDHPYMQQDCFHLSLCGIDKEALPTSEARRPVRDDWGVVWEEESRKAFTANSSLKLTSQVRPDNMPSQRVLEKLGLKKVALREDALRES